MRFNQVWTEKYRPQNIEDAILNEEEKTILSSFTEIPNNLLFIGSPGIGKSTIAKILAKKFAPNSYLYISASEEGNIDTVRNVISDFISVSSIDGNQKIVILDEADGVSLVAQQALRSVMEEYLDSVKFILTANYRNKLIEPIRSRCQEFVFSCSEKQVLQRIIFILKSEKIEISKDQIENIKSLMRDFYPDVRKTINELQKSCSSGSFLYTKNNRSGFAKQVKECLKSGEDIFSIRQKVIDNTDKFSNDYNALMKDLFHLYVLDKNQVALLLISEYMYRHTFVLDPEINFTALLLNLKKSS